jgi:hypothetical protein
MANNQTVGKPGTQPTPGARGATSNLMAEVNKLGSEKAGRLRDFLTRKAADLDSVDPRGGNRRLPVSARPVAAPRALSSQ